MKIKPLSKIYANLQRLEHPMIGSAGRLARLKEINRLAMVIVNREVNHMRLVRSAK